MAMTETDPTSIELRAITPDDAEVISELSRQLGYEASVSEIKARIAAMSRRSDHFALVASVHGVVIGWIEAEIARHLQSAPHALITGLVVKEEARSLGIGKRLCGEVERWAVQNGLTVVRVTSRITRERAHRFYLREGFLQIKTSAVFEKVLPNDAA